MSTLVAKNLQASDQIRLRPASAGYMTPLHPAIEERQATRRQYDGREIARRDLRQLETASRQEGVGFRLFTESGDIEPLVELVEEGNRAQFRDPEIVEELITWIRFNAGEVEARGDGLAYAAMGLPSIPRWLGRL